MIGIFFADKKDFREIRKGLKFKKMFNTKINFKL